VRTGAHAWVGEPAGAPPATAGATVGQ